MTEKFPKPARKLVREYFNLPLGGKKIPCPYFINVKKLRMGLRVLIGKGTPEEIVQESLIYEKLRGVNFSKMSIEEIREFMVKRHIGIDCAGFVVHILDFWLKATKKKHLWQYLKFPKQNLYRIIARKLRPVENVSAWLLTNDDNSQEVKNLDNIKVGDLIRAKGLRKNSYHVMLVSEIEKENGKVLSFKYLNSTREYEDKHGVREGGVTITDPKKKLVDQQWHDKYKGRNWTYEEIKSDTEYSQVRRLTNVPIY